MAFLKFANARVVLPRVNLNSGTWDKVRTASQDGRLTANLVDQASEIFKRAFDPNQFLLSHVTIVASVQTEDVPNVKLGSFQDGGRKLVRKYSDYHVRPECEPFINNNEDSWSHPVLQKSYRTFVGAHNFVEHVQIEDLSKGRILDAVLRHPTGINSRYCDILIATELRHSDLIQQIESGELSTLSMGCSVLETVCTKCGNVAEDETDMCNCIRYQKGSTFYDGLGQKRRIAELCGHESLEPTGGVEFIEASWVKVPAFKGAVLRNLLAPKEIRDMVASGPYEIFSRPSEHVSWVEGRHEEAYKKVASKQAFDFGDDEGEEEEAAPEKSPFEELEDEIQKDVINRVKRRIRDQLKDEPQEAGPTPEESTADLNHNLLKEAALQRKADLYRGGLTAIVKTSGSNTDLVDRVARFNFSMGIEVPVEIYRTAVEVGPSSGFSSMKKFLKTCASSLGRVPSRSESATLIRLGHLLSARADGSNC